MSRSLRKTALCFRLLAIGAILLASSCSSPMPMPNAVRPEISVAETIPGQDFPESPYHLNLQPAGWLERAERLAALSQGQMELGHARAPSSAGATVHLIPVGVQSAISPYSSSSRSLLDRVVVEYADGSWGFTRAMRSEASDNDPAGVYLPRSGVSLRSDHGTILSTGVFQTVPIDPVSVAESGFVVVANVRGIPAPGSLVVAPRFDEKTHETIYTPDAPDGRNGSAGNWGRDGYPGQGGSMGSTGLPGRRGSNGGDGTDGGDGQAGRRGEDGSHGPPGQDAPTLTVRVKPIRSRFFEQELMWVQITGDGRTTNAVLNWEQAFSLIARGGRGGDGGAGGDGGRGGSGGSGGPGGQGGAGGDGVQGSRGRDGFPGSPGMFNAPNPASARGGNGTDGGPGGPGGRGGDGANGGRGGDGGNGARGGDGGNGGNGGNGGRGANINVTIEGSRAFIAMVQRAIRYDVTGGAPGDGSAAGAGGQGGAAGNGGSAGWAGSGGRGGPGGLGGYGGAGGAGGTWVSRPNPNAPPIVLPGMMGNPGRPGMMGSTGSPGNSGRQGTSGSAGRSANAGTPGRPGSNGRRGEDGVVTVTTRVVG